MFTASIAEVVLLLASRRLLEAANQLE